MTVKCFFTREMSVSYTLLTLILLCGCGGGQPWEKVYPVDGVVTYKGKTVKDAELAFFPLDENAPESVRPWAKSKETGEFSVSTYNNGDGAPVGKYKVTVVHHEIVISGGSMGSKPNDLPKKYANKDTTDLIVEVKAGEGTVLELELK